MWIRGVEFGVDGCMWIKLDEEVDEVVAGLVTLDTGGATHS